jgi:hypothetical protein
MKTRFLLASSASLLLARGALAAPVITSSDPPSLVECAPGGVPCGQGLEIWGTNFVYPTTNGYTIGQDETTYVRWNGGPWQAATGNGSYALQSSWSPSSFGLQVTVMGPGTYDFMVCRSGGDCSAPYSIPVNPRFTQRPLFTETSYRMQVVPDSDTNDRDRLLYVGREYVNGYDTDVVWINGQRAQLWGMAGDSWGYFYVPSTTLDHPGSYSMLIGTDNGWSANSATLEIWGAPSATISPSVTTSSSDVVVALTFVPYAVPDPGVTISSPYCSVSATLQMTSSTGANVTVPAACVNVNNGYDVTIAMTNWVGSSTVTLGRAYVPTSGGTGGGGGGGAGGGGGHYHGPPAKAPPSG